MPLRAEVRLAAVDDAGHLGDDAAHDVGLGAGADAGDVRQPGQRRRTCRRRSRARRTATPAASSSAPCSSTIVRSSVLLPLRGPPTTATWPAAPARSTVRVSRRCSRGRSTVPSGHDEAAERAPLAARPGRARGSLDEVGHQLVEGVGHVERRQPDLVRRRAVADHPVDGDVEQRLAARPAGSTGAGSRLAAPSAASSVSTSEIVNGRMPRSVPPSSRRTARPAASAARRRTPP